MFGFTRSPGNQGFKSSLIIKGSPGHSNPFDSDSGSRDTTRCNYNPFASGSCDTTGCNYNPFDSDTGSDSVTSRKQTPVTGRRRAFETAVLVPDFSTPDMKRRDLEVEDQSVYGVENQMVHKAEETTSTVKRCLKFAEEIRGDAVRTLEMLHCQGQNITKTHNVTVDIDRDLSKGEKLLGTLGSIFSRTWRPKKNRDITGPLTMTEYNDSNNHQHKEQREYLGISKNSNIRSASRTSPSEPTNAFQKLQNEKERQDDALSDLSNILVDLKDMALEMGSEIERQNIALGHLAGDVDELNYRVKGANQRTRQLLGK